MSATETPPQPREETAVPAVEVEGVTVRYGDVVALEDVGLRVRQGRICGLVGTNGSGKSTLFTAVMGLTPVQSGSVRILGLGPDAARGRGLLGYVPQSEQVDWAFPLRVSDVVMMGRYGHMGPARRPRRADRAAVAEALERTGLIELAHRQIGALSGGQRKRAFVARGIAQGARVFLLDEPFAGVDKRSEAAIVEVLSAMRDEGHTLVLSTHDLAGVPRLCDEAVLLQRRLLAQGAPEDVLSPELLAQAFGIAPRPEGRAA
ncbi:metal ABC transporter ATP-binding protein [Streptomonospora litoralis]|uniref:Putative siderophore transport system ATP-binding protein YusV n=1 Tax=Streptomonospora litoralis TaxID=2498135 RepID=A0A4P6Q0X3_9ACTN|nr:metal ABC transporter ATP-binding protein [Streptomonospora litoralis]QBI54286.1 putative siderophore transport system ATP-binding protein YusV [Streptomonospora litoralis]